MMTNDLTETFVRLLTRHERDLYRYVVSLLPGAPEMIPGMPSEFSVRPTPATLFN